MEKKTMGAFLTVLRKAKGMTQKELGDRLNVSDKTVSRWEREEGYPDLSLIPVIAEIFEVSCDELLRGEKKAPADKETEITAKGERERKRLLKLTLSRYRSQTSVAMAISALGVTAALVMNLGFLKGTLGYLLGMVFFIISIVMQILCKNQAWLSVEDSGISNEEQSDFWRQVIVLGRQSGAMAAGCLGFTLPMLLAGSHAGLQLDKLFLFGIPGMLLCLIAYGIGCWFANAWYLRKGVYTLSEKEETAHWHNHDLKKKCFCRAAAALAITLAFHAFGSEMIWNQGSLVQGHRFEDYESFAAFMAQDIQESRITVNGLFSSSTQHIAPAQPVEWYDESGNVIPEEEARTHTLEDANGAVVCTYAWYNETVSTIRPTPGEGTALPIIVTTHAQQAFARNTSALINGGYCIVYPLEFLTAFWVYFKKRMK